MTAAILAIALVTAPFRPHLAVSPVIRVLPAETSTSIRGQASWYCRPGISRCTHGYPSSGMYAAAGPALRVGNWRGRLVRVCAALCIRVRLIDCNCGPNANLIDLYAAAFRRLAPLGQGVVTVEVSW